VQGCLINQNGNYGIYAEGMNQLLILNNEFAGYYEGSIIPSHQAIPILLNGGNLITIEHNAFENNEAYNVRTGYDGNSDTTNMTRNLLIRSNDFKPIMRNGNLTHLRLRYARQITIQNNHFEASNTYAGTFVAIEQGILPDPPNMVCFNNEWDTDLDTQVAGAAQYLWIEKGLMELRNT
jgi:hypothetical protein